MVFRPLLQKSRVLAQRVKGGVDLVPLVLPAFDACAHLGLALHHVLEVPLEAIGARDGLVKDLPCLLQQLRLLRQVCLQLLQVGARPALPRLEALHVRAQLVKAALDAVVNIIICPLQVRSEHLQLALQVQQPALQLRLRPCGDLQLVLELLDVISGSLVILVQKLVVHHTPVYGVVQFLHASVGPADHAVTEVCQGRLGRFQHGLCVLEAGIRLPQLL
mmetsp:Transcript_33446/g.92593  ORF Transcript_33446/g.92593 Transcript_33446/m.92593 type:complete len:219 (-) Transcript_33446:204-860(-)